MKDALKFGTTTVDAVIALAAFELLLLPHWGHLCTFMHNEFPQSAHKPARQLLLRRSSAAAVEKYGCCCEQSSLLIVC